MVPDSTENCWKEHLLNEIHHSSLQRKRLLLHRHEEVRVDLRLRERRGRQVHPALLRGPCEPLQVFFSPRAPAGEQRLVLRALRRLRRHVLQELHEGLPVQPVLYQPRIEVAGREGAVSATSKEAVRLRRVLPQIGVRGEHDR